MLFDLILAFRSITLWFDEPRNFKRMSFNASINRPSTKTSMLPSSSFVTSQEACSSSISPSR